MPRSFEEDPDGRLELTAERIFTLEFGGDPWVGRESPVSSIDPAVTEAVMRH